MARRMSRFIHFAMAAATEAVRTSGLDFATWPIERRDRVGVVINTGGGGMEQVIEGTHVLEDAGPGQVSPFAIPALSGSMAAPQVSMRYGLTGPVITQVAACASGVIAFQDALRLIRTGECDVVVAGGSEAPLLPIAFAALGNMGALSKRNDDPETASRPFDATRDGFVFGEGAAVVRRRVGGARDRRGARRSWRRSPARRSPRTRSTSAPRSPPGAAPARAMTGAMADAGVTPERDRLHRRPRHVDAAQRRHRDAGDQGRLRRAGLPGPDLVAEVDDRAPARRGRDAAAALAAIGAIRDGWIPPTANLHDPDPECDLDYVPLVKREQRVDTAMVNGFGFGGQNAVAIFRRFEE